MPASHSSNRLSYLSLISLRGHAEVSRLDLFHQGNSHAPCATIHSRPLQFDPCHSSDCGRDIGETLLGIRIPRHHIAGLSLLNQFVGNHPLPPGSCKAFHQFSEGRHGIGRNSIQAIPGIITPHQAVDDPINAPHRHVNADQPSAGPTFRPDEPRGRPITGKPFFDSLGMHPIAAAAYKHVCLQPLLHPSLFSQGTGYTAWCR